jgi:hypothetical protein
MSDPNSLPTKNVSVEHSEAVIKKMSEMGIDIVQTEALLWQQQVKLAVEHVLGPVHVGQLAPGKLIFVRVEPDEDGLHAKLEITF